MRWALVLIAAGCFGDPVVPCGAISCPTSRVCAPAQDRCVFPDQIEACVGAGEGDACAAATVSDGLCHAEVCVTGGCGNEVIEPGELCDDGNRYSLDGCSSDCRSDERCGNGVVDAAFGEQCDCGDSTGPLPAGCEGANSDAPGAGCRTTCQLASCGDRVVDPGEWCDDGNHVAGDGCRADCAGRFTLMASGTLRTLNAAYASGPNDAFAVGEQRILHYDGIAWSNMTLPAPASYLAVCGMDSTHVYAVADSGRLDAYDGNAWTTMTLPSAFTARDLACPSTGLIVAGFTDSTTGVVIRWDGSAWTAMPTLAAQVHRIWSAGADDIYTSTKDLGTIVLHHYESGAWQDVVTPTIYSLGDLWGTSATDVYVISPLARYDGTTWAADPGSDEHNLVGLGGTAGDILGVGSAYNGSATFGAVSRFDGDTWQLLPLPTVPPLYGAAGYEPGRTFLVGAYGTILY